MSDAEHTAAETDAYLKSKLVHPGILAGHPALDKHRRRAMDEGVSDTGVSAIQGQFLSVLAKGRGAQKILEIGTLWGYSTFFLASILPKHGQIDALELSPLHARLANELFLETDLYPFPKVHIGPALDILRDRNGLFVKPLGTEEGLPLDQRGYDLVFIDADQERIYEYFMESIRLTRKGGLILVDNAIRGGRIATKENDVPGSDVMGSRRLCDWAKRDKGKMVTMSGIQTVGSKAWDGFAMAVKL